MADLARLYTFVDGNVIRAAEVNAELDQFLARINDLEPESLNSVLASYLGISQAAGVRRGKSNIATSETRTNTAFGLMPTPDRVQSVVLPTDGLIAVGFQATWRESVSGAASAAIFIGANQLKYTNQGSIGPVAQEGWTTGGGLANVDLLLATSGVGLVGQYPQSPQGYTEVTTGTSLGVLSGAAAGGVCFIFAAAGTYDVSVQFKASSGNVTAKNRKLWVWTVGF